jgi:hypothetical protein
VGGLTPRKRAFCTEETNVLHLPGFEPRIMQPVF